MKRLSLAVAVGVGCLLFQNAHATLLFEDGFNYSAGSLTTSDSSPAGYSGNAWSSGSSHIAVQSGDLTYSGLQDLGGNEVLDTWGVSAGSVINTYANQTSGSIYYSFLIDVTAIGTINSYITSLNPGTTSPGGSADALTAYVKSDGSGWEIGVRTSGAGTVEDTAAGTAGLLSLNTTYLVVMEYTFSSEAANIWVDPSSSTFGGSAPTADVSTNGTVSFSSGIDNVGFKAQGTGSSTYILDNLLIGTTWADVTPVPEPAPEPSTFALAGFGLLGLVARFRRARR
jgi:hypothetical protein